MEAVSQTKQKFESLDELRAFLLKTKDLSEIYSQKDIIDAIAHLNVTEEETEELLAWMEENMISLDSDEEDEEEQDLVQSEEEELDEVSAEISQLEQAFAQASQTRINDPVKMYLKEIGQIPLLKADEEKEIAKRITEGDLEAKEILISSNLRLVVSIAKNM